VVSVPVYHHLGLYAFQREFLEIYSKLDPSSLEICEGLEQLRVIENGYSITVSLTEEKMIEINIPSDLEKAKMYI
jgi:3-deoxy-manno-octulosonate cytidylyltransferase (CMP-KDO synthetase)